MADVHPSTCEWKAEAKVWKWGMGGFRDEEVKGGKEKAQTRNGRADEEEKCGEEMNTEQTHAHLWVEHPNNNNKC